MPSENPAPAAAAAPAKPAPPASEPDGATSNPVPPSPREDQPPAAPRKRGGNGWFWLVALALAVVLAIVAGFRFFKSRGIERERQATSQAQQSGARTVQVVRPQRSPATFDFSLPGNAQALQEATLFARTNGYLRERLVDIGDQVKAGQLLARIEAPDVDAQLRQAQATLDQRRANLEINRVTLERQKKLLAEKVTSQQEFDQNLANFRQAEADTKAAEANVQNLSVQQGFQRITAPFDGVITERNLDVGALINAGGGSSTTAPSLFHIAQTDMLRVYISVPQAYSNGVGNGTEVTITAPQFPKQTFKGKVTRSADSLDPAARTERVEIQLPSMDGKLLPGMYLTVRFTVTQAEPVMLVPASVLDIRREGPRVAVVGPDGKVAFKPVSLGRDMGVTVEVASGLKGDEQLVINPTTDLQAGEQVEVAKPKDDKAAGPTGRT